MRPRRTAGWAALGLLSAALAVSARAATEAELQALNDAQAREAALARLVTAAQNLERAAWPLRWDVQRLRSETDALPARAARLADAADRVARCPAELRQAGERQQQAGERVLQGHDAVRRAVLALSVATRAARPERVRRSDDANARLRAAVAELDDSTDAFSEVAQRCDQQQQFARDAVSQYGSLQERMQMLARHGIDRSFAGWREAAEAARAARAAVDLRPESLPLLPERSWPASLDAMIPALAGLPVLDPVRPPTPFEQLDGHASRRLDGVITLGTQADALTYIDATDPRAARPCRPPRCSGAALERQALEARRAQQAETLAALSAERPGIDAAMDAGVRTLLEARETIEARRPALEAALDAGTRPLEAWLAETKTATTALLEAADRERRAAFEAFAQRYVIVHGRRPPTVAMAPMDPMKAAPAEPPVGGSAMKVTGHAYATIQRLGGEPDNFRAYTYVIVKSAPSPQDQRAYKRLGSVISTLQESTAASRVDAASRRSTNVFCIPTGAGESAGLKEMVDQFDADLAKQILTRVQAGVFASQDTAVKGLQHRLTRGNGPFLLSMPVRAEESTSTTPVLLADLSDQDDEAIADVVNAYKSGLIDRFPEQKELWKPPGALRVALAVVRWATGPGRMISDSIPAATAKPSR